MYKEILRNIDGVEIYPIISLLLFFIVFVVMIIYVLTINKSTVHEMSSLPLDNKTSHEE